MTWAEVEDTVAGAVAVAALNRGHYLPADDCRHIARTTITVFQELRLKIVFPPREEGITW